MRLTDDDHDHVYVLHEAPFDPEVDWYRKVVRCDRCPRRIDHAYQEHGFWSCRECGDLACDDCAQRGGTDQCEEPDWSKQEGQS